MPSKFKRLLTNPIGETFAFLAWKHLFDWMSDEQYIKCIYRARMKRKLNLNPPKTFNEKINWLKLHDRNPKHTIMVDKYEAKKFFADAIGEEYVIPTIGVWDKFDDIDFDTLPDKFVLKCTHDSGGLVICTDKSKLDIEAAKNKIERSLKNNYYWHSREWPYKNVKPRIICEKYMCDEKQGDAIDNWKFYCCDGEIFAFYVTVGGGHTAGMEMTYFSSDGSVLPVKNINYPNCSNPVKLPEKLDDMKRIAEKLSKGEPLARVDFYYVNGAVYIGEMTFYPGSGCEKLVPDSYDRIFGDCIKLPDTKNK